jgi:hypothetical protein
MPEMKEESKQWTSPGKQAPKKAKTVPSARKVMATIFRDSKGIIFIDYLEKGRTITGQYCDQLWGNFDDVLKEKWPHLAKKKSAVPPSQCAGTPIPRCRSEFGGIGL